MPSLARKPQRKNNVVAFASREQAADARRVRRATDAMMDALVSSWGKEFGPAWEQEARESLRRRREELDREEGGAK